MIPTMSPTKRPTMSPTKRPTMLPTMLPTKSPSKRPTMSPTKSPSNNDPRQLCLECGDKSSSIDGEGKVTGGGWIYLTSNTYYDPAKVCNPGTTKICVDPYLQVLGPGGPTPLVGKKANFGFNAMFRKGLPYGSTNFDFDGGMFHFHSTTKNTPYKFLEVVDEYHARWFGTGTLACTANPKKNDFRDGFCFMVSVQDHGEPGATDTWRIRIWQCTTSGNSSPLDWSLADFAAEGSNQANLVFDTNYVPLTNSAHAAYLTNFPLPSEFEASDLPRYRFNGTELGELNSNGGGNIQIHKKGKPSPDLAAILQSSGTCDCANTTYEGDCTSGFVTGGGFIILDKNEVFLKGVDSAGLDGITANFGFNAKAFFGSPTGSTNFNVAGPAGKFFHFHTQNNGNEYDGLQVICSGDTKYGPDANSVFARWTGVGKVSRTVNPDDGWVSGYRFYVAVQDMGEPGFRDTFRIKIYEPNGGLFFDNLATSGDEMWEHDPACQGNTCTRDTWLADFSGSSLGGYVGKGGGNVQVHCKGGPTKACPNGVPSNVVARTGSTTPPPLPAPTTPPVVITSPMISASTHTNFATLNAASCGGNTCVVGPWKCGGANCTYTANNYVTLTDNLRHESSLYTVVGVAGKSKVTFSISYKTEDYHSSTKHDSFTLDYSFQADAATANFLSPVIFGRSTTTRTTPPFQINVAGYSTVILRIMSNVNQITEKLYVYSANVTIT